MIIDIIQKYSEIIAEYDITKFRVTGNSYQLIGNIRLTNQSQLFFKDYLFSDGSRKYSFHWQDVHGNCIVRWDNAPHYQNVSSFPYHKHIGKEEAVFESHPMKLESVLEYIREQLKDKI